MKKILLRSLLTCLVIILAVIYLVQRPALVWGEAGALVQQASAERLQQHVRYLSEQLSSRHYQDLHGLNQAADYVAAQWQALGLPVSRQTFEVEGVTYQNIITHIGPETGQWVIIGAHYDAFDELPGADDNASGVAGLLELARLLQANPPPVPVELVAFTLEEPPFFASQNMGSAQHAGALDKPVRLMISLEMIGYFSSEPDTQHYPLAALSWLYPSTGDFIAVVDQLWSHQAAAVKKAFNQHTPLEAYSIHAPAALVGVDFSDHRNYWAQDIPAVMITDTAFYRNQHYHTAEDTWDKLDYQKMGQVVDGVQALLHHELD